MKKYIQPTMDIVKVELLRMIAASGDSRNMTIYDQTINNTTFNSREFDYDYEDEEE